MMNHLLSNKQLLNNFKTNIENDIEILSNILSLNQSYKYNRSYLTDYSEKILKYIDQLNSKNNLIENLKNNLESNKILKRKLQSSDLLLEMTLDDSWSFKIKPNNIDKINFDLKGLALTNKDIFCICKIKMKKTLLSEDFFMIILEPLEVGQIIDNINKFVNRIIHELEG